MWDVIYDRASEASSARITVSRSKKLSERNWELLQGSVRESI